MIDNFLSELKYSKINASIIREVEEVERVDINLTVDEIVAVYRTCQEVYNSFCNNSDEDDGFSVYLNRYLDDLHSAIEKLNW